MDKLHEGIVHGLLALSTIVGATDIAKVEFKHEVENLKELIEEAKSLPSASPTLNLSEDMQRQRESLYEEANKRYALQQIPAQDMSQFELAMQELAKMTAPAKVRNSDRPIDWEEMKLRP